MDKLLLTISATILASLFVIAIKSKDKKEDNNLDSGDEVPNWWYDWLD